MTIVNSYIAKINGELISDGENMIKLCREQATFTNRTNNLEDSYGSCVYFNGVEVSNSRRYLGQKATVGVKWYGETIYGRNEIDSFFDSYKPIKNGWELLLVAAMPYGEVVEHTYKYKVIAMSHDMLEQLVPKYKNNSYVKKIVANG